MLFQIDFQKRLIYNKTWLICLFISLCFTFYLAYLYWFSSKSDSSRCYPNCGAWDVWSDFPVFLSIAFGSIFSSLFELSFLKAISGLTFSNKFFCKKSVQIFLDQKHLHFGKTNLVILIQVEKFYYGDRKCLIHIWCYSTSQRFDNNASSIYFISKLCRLFHFYTSILIMNKMCHGYVNSYRNILPIIKLILEQTKTLCVGIFSQLRHNWVIIWFVL